MKIMESKQRNVITTGIKGEAEEKRVKDKNDERNNNATKIFAGSEFSQMILPWKTLMRFAQFEQFIFFPLLFSQPL